MTVKELMNILQDLPCDLELFLDSNTAKVPPLDYIDLDEDIDGEPLLIFGTNVSEDTSIDDFELSLN